MIQPHALPAPGPVRIRRALLSVSDKTALDTFARALHDEFNVQLISTGGTAAFLRNAGLPVTDVSEITGFPEMMDGRVKTLHPKIHGALLALRDLPEHQRAMRQHGIEPIDLVCINLYPFEQTIARPDVTMDEAIENIDIGGPSMIRSAAKNHRHITVATSPGDYDAILDNLRANGGQTSPELRRRQAQRAFARTARYDGAIARYLEEDRADEPLPRRLHLDLQREALLRYGENPHQKGALYVDQKPSEASVAFATQHHGKELSYINLFDADGALAAVKEFTTPAACIVKHATPCGLATAGDLPTAFTNAFEGDPVAAFGGIVALNQPVDVPTADAITAIKVVLDVIVAPSFAPEALELLKTRWKNTRILEVGPMGTPDPRELHLHKIAGGLLVQQRDLPDHDESTWKVASRRQPTEAELNDLRFAWVAAKHVKSNAIALAHGRAMIGSGAGQQDRVNACRIAVDKAGGRARGSVAASDAFFPFPDGPQVLLDAGITAIIQPGGSLRDQETIDIVNQYGAAMILTGQRHFRH